MTPKVSRSPALPNPYTKRNCNLCSVRFHRDDLKLIIPNKNPPAEKWLCPNCIRLVVQADAVPRSIHPELMEQQPTT